MSRAITTSPTVRATVTGLAARAVVAFALLGRAPLVSDAASYDAFARSLLGSFPGHEAYYWPPGNSMLLAGVYALLGASTGVARGVMVILGAAAVPLTARVARELDPESERAAAWICALYPPAVMLVAQTYAQHLAALSMLAFAWLALAAMRSRRASLFALAGLALGAGCLTRPSMASLAPVLLVFFIVYARRARARGPAREDPRAIPRLLLGGALLVAVASALVVPVALHNAGLGAGFTISTNNERNLFLGNNPYTPSYKTSHLGQRSLDELEPETRAYLESFYARPDARAAMQREALGYMAHHPVLTAYRTLNRTTSFWGFDYLASRVIQEDRGWGKKGLMPLLALEAGGYVAVAALALVGLFAFKPSCDRDGRAWLAWLVVAYEAPYAIAFSGGTYHFPAMAIVVPLAAVAVARWREMTVRVRESKLTMVAIALLLLVQVQYAYYAILMS